MKKNSVLLFPLLLILIFSNSSFAQDTGKAAEDDLEALLNKSESKTKEYVKYTFKGTRVVNLQSVEKVAPGTLQFMIQHRFGPFNGGAYQIWGLDQATIRFGLEYGLSKFITVGAGRSSYNKNYDGYIKTTLIRQSKGGKGSFPLSVLYFGSMNINSMEFNNPDIQNYFSSRLSYTSQLIIGSKVNENFSFEIVPTHIHKNIVATHNDPNNIYAIGFGIRYKLTKRISVNGEYIYRIPPKDKTLASYANYHNSMSAGFDIETGGHVFQLHLTNSLPMYEAAFITETAETWKNVGIHLGFNISRDFVLDKKAATRRKGKPLFMSK
jgi:opacity protein-like surface antigen